MSAADGPAAVAGVREAGESGLLARGVRRLVGACALDGARMSGQERDSAGLLRFGLSIECETHTASGSAEEDEMSAPTPQWQPPQTSAEWDALLRGWLTNNMNGLNAIASDVREPLSMRQVASQAASTAGVATIVLSLLTGLTNTVTELNGIVSQLITRAHLDETERAEMQERVQQLEYATVTEAQAERIKEQIVGDLADLMAGRLRGEDHS